MIIEILQSYLILFLSVGFVSLFILILGLIFIFRNTNPKKTKHKDVVLETAHQSRSSLIASKNKSGTTVELTKQLKQNSTENMDLSAICGDDIFSTHLDLARAYIETGKIQLAEKILQEVKQQGSLSQQQTAQELLSFI